MTRLEIHRSARKHGVADGDIVHAVEHALVVADLDDGPPLRVLLVGPDRAVNLLEIIVLAFDDERVLVIHAMPLRATYHHVLP